MTVDEMKSTLLTATEEGADAAAIFDSVMTEVAEMNTKLDEAQRNVEELTGRVTELTDTNLKLLEKVKYMSQAEELEEHEEEIPEVTIDNLFEEV